MGYRDKSSDEPIIPDDELNEILDEYPQEAGLAVKLEPLAGLMPPAAASPPQPSSTPQPSGPSTTNMERAQQLFDAAWNALANNKMLGTRQDFNRLEPVRRMASVFYLIAKVGSPYKGLKIMDLESAASATARSIGTDSFSAAQMGWDHRGGYDWPDWLWRTIDDLRAAGGLLGNPEDQIELLDGSIIEIKPKARQHFWPGRLVQNALNLLTGDGGTVKSTIRDDLVARVTNGGLWPDGEKIAGGQGSVLMIIGEECWEDTVLPRLIHFKADLSRIQRLDSFKKGGQLIMWNFEHPEVVRAKLKTMPDCRLITIDPLSEFCGKYDINKMTDVKAMLAPYSRIAEEFGVTILITHHNNKNQGIKAAHKVSGSAGIINTVRAAWACTLDVEATAMTNQQDDGSPGVIRKKVYGFTCSKFNAGLEAKDLRYAVEPLDPDDPACLAKLTWETEGYFPSGDALAAAETNAAVNGGVQANQAKSLTADVMEMLKDLLKNGPMQSSEAEDMLKEQGATKQTIRDARQQLNIKPRKKMFHGVQCWVWGLPGWETQYPDHELNPKKHDSEKANFDESHGGIDAAV